MLPRSVAGNGTRPGDRLTLDAARRNERLRVLRVAGRPRLIQRLAALGVVPGAELTVLKPASPSIISLGGARIAIGKAAAEAVEVEVA